MSDAARYGRKSRSKADTVHEAAEIGSLAKIEARIKVGIENGYPESVTLQEREEVLGMMPIHLACEYGQLEVVKYLISKRVDLDAGDNFRVTPMHLACIENHLPVIKALLDARASVRPFDTEGDQPIHWAATKGNVEVIKLLLAWNASSDTPNNSGWTPLHRAAYNGRTAALEVLAAAGASVQAVNKDGMTPLHCACFMNQLNTLETLCKLGAKLDVLTIKRQTPFDLCITDAAREILGNFGTGFVRKMAISQSNKAMEPAQEARPSSPKTTRDATALAPIGGMAKLTMSSSLSRKQAAEEGFPDTEADNSPRVNKEHVKGDATQFMKEATGNLDSERNSPYQPTSRASPLPLNARAPLPRTPSATPPTSTSIAATSSSASTSSAANGAADAADYQERVREQNRLRSSSNEPLLSSPRTSRPVSANKKFLSKYNLDHMNLFAPA